MICCIVAVRAGIVSVPSDRSTGGCLSFMMYKDMILCRYLSISCHSAYGTFIICIVSGFGTGGFESLVMYELMTCSRDSLKIGISAFLADFVSIPAVLGAGRFLFGIVGK